jgi:hypothetical protein
MRSHIYYVFSSTLLASCSVPLRESKLRAASPRVAMTERCGLTAELSTALGQLRRFVAVCSVDISFKRQFRDL